MKQQEKGDGFIYLACPENKSVPFLVPFLHFLQANLSKGILGKRQKNGSQMVIWILRIKLWKQS